MKLNKLESFLGLLMLIGAIGFNLWLYRVEPTTKVDPNDNAFQFALVERTNTMWDFATKKCATGAKILVFPVCHFGYMIDHWVPNWAEGYNLPFYYSHMPQIAIVATFRFLAMMLPTLSLFSWYHLVIYLLLCFFPLSIFVALRILRTSWTTAGIGALIAMHLSTDGLYGLDPSSFLWRGFGLSSQLFAMIFLPIAIAYSHVFFSTLFWEIETRSFPALLQRWITSLVPFQKTSSSEERATRRAFWGAVLFLTLTAMGHLGIGMIVIISLLPLAIVSTYTRLMEKEHIERIKSAAISSFTALVILGGTVVFFLSYWVVPIVLGDNYHNISFWDPIWKFNSYGWFEIIKNLFNGDLFDFGRAPIITVLVFVGLFATLSLPHAGLSILFIFWLLMYFGRTTWGPMIDFIPGMKEFHISRFIVGIHVVGMLLAPLGIEWGIGYILSLTKKLKRLKITQTQETLASWTAVAIVLVILLPPIYRYSMKYNELNELFIKRANDNYEKAKKDNDELFATIRSLTPARIFTGRGGWWGKDFRIAETPYYMHLSTYGLPTVLWMPQTWSPNSDTEQYFSEDVADHYDLYNMRWVATPPNQESLKFWKLTRETPSWKLYEVPTDGYFTVGARNQVVVTDKRSFLNIVHLWTQSNFSKQRLFPQITFKTLSASSSLPTVRMIDEVTYKTPDGTIENIFTKPPLYQASPAKATLVGPEKTDSDMVFSTTVNVEKDCTECLLVLKQTYHPNWRATVDGKSVTPINVFPFFTAVELPTEGKHEVTFEYKPSTLKIILLIVECIGLVILLVPLMRGIQQKPK